MIELKFSNDDPRVLRADMAAMLGVDLPRPEAKPIVSEETLLADAKARAEGKNLDGSERRETTEPQAETAEATSRTTGRRGKATARDAQKPASIVADVVPAQPEAAGNPLVEAVAATLGPALVEINKIVEEVKPNIQAQPENREPPTELTVDSVRAAAMKYVTKFKLDMAVAGDDLAKCLIATKGVGVGKISLLDPKNQEQLKAAVEAFETAAAADKRYGQ